MKIYVIRHGETEMGKNRFIATKEEPLNSNGIEQAIRVGKDVRKLNIDLIYCSPVRRVKDTLKLMNIKKNIPIIIDQRIEERDMGMYEGKPFHELDWEKFWGIDSEKTYRNVESMKDVYKRVNLFLEEVKKQKKENVLIVTHGGIEIAIDWYFKGFDTPLLKCENAKIYEYSID